MTLHIVTTSTYRDAALQECLAVADSQKDALVLMADGVCGLHSPLLRKAGIKVFYLADDTHARGMIGPRSGSQRIGYPELVKLTEAHQSIHTWL